MLHIQAAQFGPPPSPNAQRNRKTVQATRDGQFFVVAKLQLLKQTNSQTGVEGGERRTETGAPVGSLLQAEKKSEQWGGKKRDRQTETQRETESAREAERDRQRERERDRDRETERELIF